MSYYVQAADELVEQVLKHESFLFTDKEERALRRLRGLNCEFLPPLSRTLAARLVPLRG